MAGSPIFSTFRCTFLNRHMIVWFSWIISICEIYGEYGTAGHLAGAPNGNFRENICSEDDLRTRIFGTFVVKFLACLLLLGFSNFERFFHDEVLGCVFPLFS